MSIFYLINNLSETECNDFEVVNQPIEVVLSKILEGTGFVFSKADGVYVIKKSTEKTVQSVEPLSSSGVVTDTDGIPLPGVTVLVKELLWEVQPIQKGNLNYRFLHKKM